MVKNDVSMFFGRHSLAHIDIKMFKILHCLDRLDKVGDNWSCI